MNLVNLKLNLNLVNLKDIENNDNYTFVKGEPGITLIDESQEINLNIYPNPKQN